MYAHCVYICDDCIKKVTYKSEVIMEFQEFCIVYLKWNFRSFALCTLNGISGLLRCVP